MSAKIVFALLALMVLAYVSVSDAVLPTKPTGRFVRSVEAKDTEADNHKEIDPINYKNVEGSIEKGEYRRSVQKEAENEPETYENGVTIPSVERNRRSYITRRRG